MAHTPFDLTLTFCDVRPLSEQDIKSAEESQTVRAPVVARIAMPFGVVPGLVAALQEQMRAVQERRRRRRRTRHPGPRARRTNSRAMAAQRRGRRTVAHPAAERRPTRASDSRRDRAAGSSTGSISSIRTPETELHYRNPYELLVATILSAQCTDARVNR